MTQVPKLPVAILGATGAVGQRLVAALANHPWFELAELVASERSAGKPYGEAAHWLLPEPPLDAVIRLPVIRAGEPLRSHLVFSALDRGPALELEPRYAAAGHLVVSNASAFRDDSRVPLLIPEINPHALELLDHQPWAAAGGGIVTNPNCCVAGLALALAPLQREFGIAAVTVVTLQALSGAGHPGVASLDALGNVIPFIAGEEEKIAAEPLKILGAEFPVSVAVNRVPVRDGHSESVFVKLREPASLEAIAAALRNFRGDARVASLPSAPGTPLELLEAGNRPQPLLDLNRGDGMTVTLGNLRADPVYDCRFNLLVHNTVRGAAGAAVLNAEWWAARCGIIRAAA